MDPLVDGRTSWLRFHVAFLGGASLQSNTYLHADLLFCKSNERSTCPMFSVSCMSSVLRALHVQMNEMGGRRRRGPVVPSNLHLLSTTHHTTIAPKCGLTHTGREVVGRRKRTLTRLSEVGTSVIRFRPGRIRSLVSMRTEATKGAKTRNGILAKALTSPLSCSNGRGVYRPAPLPSPQSVSLPPLTANAMR